MSHRIYLAGPMRHQDSRCLEWRAEATRILAERGLEAVDPARRDFRHLTDIEAMADHRSIVDADLDDLENCVAVLANPYTPSIGTAMECWHAYSLGRPVAVVGPTLSPWYIYACSYRADTVANACDWLSAGGTVALYVAQSRRPSRHGTAAYR